MASFNAGSHYQHLWPSGTSRVTAATKPARSARPGWRYATSPGHGGPPPAPPRDHRAGPELVPTASMLCGWRNSFQWGSEMVSMVIWCQLPHFVRRQRLSSPPPPRSCAGGLSITIVVGSSARMIPESGFVSLSRTKREFRRQNSENDDIYTNANIMPHIAIVYLRASTIFLKYAHCGLLAFPEYSTMSLRSLFH